RLKRSRPTAGALRSYVGMTIIIVWCLRPFYWMVVAAFRSVGYTFDNTPWPTHVTLDNFTTAFSSRLGNHLGASLLNSLVISGITTAVGLTVGISAAYALARSRFRGKTVVLGVILGASMFPSVSLV